MSYTELIELITILLAAATKFAMALGYMLLPNMHYSYFQIVVTLLTGGSLGTFFFYFFSNLVNQWINKFFKKKKKEVIFSPKSRRFINIKNKYGLIGISLLTPILLSIPLGCFLASRFYHKNKLTVFIMLAGVVFWSFILPLVRLSY